MEAIISMVSVGSVVQVQRFGSKGNGSSRIRAVEGARYVLADVLGDDVTAGMNAKRVGKNLLIGQELEGAEQDVLIIEDFYGSGGQLVLQGADGQYRGCLAVTGSGAMDAAELSDGASSTLVAATATSAAPATTFHFSEGSSLLSGGMLASAAAAAGGIALSSVRNKSDGMPKAAPAARGFATYEPVVAAAAEMPVPAADATALSAGAHEASARTDAIGVAEQGSDTIDVKVRAGYLSTNNVPVIDAMYDDYGAIQGRIANGGYTDDGRPQIVGKADPGVLVHVYRGVELIGHTVAGADGNWAFVPRYPLADGSHAITIIHEYPSGDTSEESDPYLIVVDRVVPDPPIIIGMVDDEGRITGAITDLSITDDNRPTIDGTAEAKAILIIYDKGREIDRIQVGADGKWTYTPSTPLADGLHILSYAALDLAGNASERSVSTEFLIDTRPEKVNIYFAEDDVGSVIGEVFNGGVTDDSTPTLFGSATAGGIVKIYEGDVLLGEVVADVDGTWQLTPVVALSEGAHSFHATVTLIAKGESERSKPFTLTVDVTPPAKPTIDQVWDDVGIVQGAVAAGQTTDDRTPALSGKAEAGSTVHIYDHGSLLGSVVADANGKWTYTPSTPLIDGKHDFIVTARDKAGNPSGSSDVFEITIGTLPPTQTATVTDIGKDSGFSAHDYLTNDGSAGRLMQGKLSAALNTDEKLQVSTDGGLTWMNALVDGTHWALQDGNFHTQDWVIKTRVIDDSGQAGEVREANVRFDVTAPRSPVAVRLSGADVIVEFDGNDAIAGDKINLSVNSKSTTYTLTEADIAASKVSFLNKANEARTIIDFEPGKMGGVTVAAWNNSIDWRKDGFGAIRNGLWLGSGVGHVESTLSLPGNGAGSLSINIGALDPDHGGYVEFYNKQGVLIGKDETLSGNREYQTIKFYAPVGEVIHSFKIVTPGDGAGIIVDDLRLEASIGASIIDVAGNSSDIAYVGGGDAAVRLKQSVSSDVEWYFSNKNGTEFQIDEDTVPGGHAFNIEGGRGIDTVKLSGAGSVLNLSESAGRIHSVEILDITGTGNNTLALNLVNVLGNGAVNAFYAGDKSRVQMMVKGDVGDRVNLSDLLSNGVDVGDWAKKAAVVIDGVTYDSYQHSSLGAELLVQQGATVVLDNHTPVVGYRTLGIDMDQTQPLLESVALELFVTDSNLLSMNGPVEKELVAPVQTSLNATADLFEVHRLSYAD